MADEGHRHHNHHHPLLHCGLKLDALLKQLKDVELGSVGLDHGDVGGGGGEAVLPEGARQPDSH